MPNTPNSHKKADGALQPHQLIEKDEIYYVPNEDEKLAAYKLGQDLVAAAKKLDLE